LPGVSSGSLPLKTLGSTLGSTLAFRLRRREYRDL
jgi:hypothetical protein